MKKERIFYLDFVRAIAVILILMTHYNAVYLNAGQPDKVFITAQIGNIYIGDFGVSLFFIISGAALMYVYDEKCELKSFYKKRFLSLYPMFWIAYFIAFLYQFYVSKGINLTVPKCNILLTILGFDGYLAAVMPTFYILGEWFLGCIILIYIVFPLLRYLIRTHPVALAVVAMVLYVMFLFIPSRLDPAEVLPLRIPEILFGMYYIKYIKRIKWSVALGALAILVVNTIVAPQFNDTIQTTYIGISAFLVLAFISDYLDFAWIHRCCSVISKYSYAIFLVHHVIIMAMMATFDLTQITRFYSYLLFLTCCVVIALFAKLLYELHGAVMKEVLFLHKN